MKKLFFALVLALSAAVSAQAQTKVAHINSQTLLDTMPSRKKAIAEIMEIERRGSEELQLLNDKLEKEYYDYLNRKPGMSQDMINYEEGRLNKLQQEMQDRQAQIEKILQDMSAKVNEEVTASVKQAVDIIAKKKGLNYVIDETTTLFSNGTNITNEVIPELLRIDAEKTKAKTVANGATMPPKTN